MLELKSRSAEQLQVMGEKLGRLLSGGEVIVLSGGLGAGKTTLTQGIARGMNLDSTVTSPTFSLIHVYEGRPITLVHCDFYRLKSIHEAENIGFLDYLTPTNVVIVEWGEDYLELVPKEFTHIVLDPIPEGRSIKVTSTNKVIERWVEQCQSLA